jgi:uncharacterized protein (DUF2252 family)
MTQPLSPQERRAYGQSRRQRVHRQDHNVWSAKYRRHSPIDLIEESMRGRIPSLIALKYERMMESPFGFFRGAVPVMAADLASLPHAGICNQICGDAHVRNLGAYAAPDGRLVFDINDFDETIYGPFEWDVKRLATSVILAGRLVGERRFLCQEAALACLRRYRRLIDTLARMSFIDMVHYQIHRLQHINYGNPVSQILLKAERATPLHVLKQLTIPEKTAKKKPPSKSKSRPRIFKENKPILTRLTDAKARSVLSSLEKYQESLQPERRHFFSMYRPIDVAFKVVGTGAVGLRDYVIYFEGNGKTDPLFLQIKEEPHSAYAPYLKTAENNGHQGQRVVNGQRAMQFQPDPFLGCTTIENRNYLVRQLNDHKASIEVTDLKGQALIDYAEMCGELFARGHARSGDPCVLSGYLGLGGKFDRAITQFAEAYADQTEKDWEDLRRVRQSETKPSSTSQKTAHS